MVTFQFASWLVTQPPHVALEWVHYYHLLPQHFHILSALGHGWWATGSFNVGYSCAFPYLWNIPHILLSLDRAATPPHTPCSPTCSGFCACPWMWWHGPGFYLLSSRTLPCYIYCNLHLRCYASFCWNKLAFLWAHLMWSLSFGMYLVKVGMVINFGVSLRVT